MPTKYGGRCSSQSLSRGFFLGGRGERRVYCEYNKWHNNHLNCAAVQIIKFTYFAKVKRLYCLQTNIQKKQMETASLVLEGRINVFNI